MARKNESSTEMILAEHAHEPTPEEVKEEQSSEKNKNGEPIKTNPNQPDPIKRRQSYKASYKLAVCSYAEEKGTKAASIHFNINPAVIRKWRNGKKGIEAMEPERKANRGVKPKWPEMEQRLEHWIDEVEQSGVTLKPFEIREQAKELSGDPEFIASPSWFYRFTKRRRLFARKGEIPGMVPCMVPMFPTDGDLELPDELMDYIEYEESFVKEACNKYRLLASVPNITEGKILQSRNSHDSTSFVIGSTYSQRDIERKETRHFEKFHNVSIDWQNLKADINSFPFPAEKNNIVIQKLSSDSKLKAIIRKVTSSKDEEKQFLEIWSEGNLEKSINLTTLDKHGTVYGTGPFASLRWSADNQNILYIAEKKKPKKMGYFDRTPPEGKQDKECESDYNILEKGNCFQYEEDWGEQLTGQSNPAIAVYNLITDELKLIEEVPEHISPGQAIWGPSESILFVGWWNTPYRLGPVYCGNRRNAIFHIKFLAEEIQCHQLSGDHCSVHSPRLSPDQSRMIYLEREAGGPHRSYERLVMHDFMLKRCSVLIDIVDEVTEENPGLCTYRLPDRCWFDKNVILETTLKTNRILVMINIETGRLQKITSEDGAWTLLDVHDNFILASFSTPNQCSSIRLGRISSGMEISWVSIHKDSPVTQRVRDSLSWQHFNVTVVNNNEEIELHSVLWIPTNSPFGKPPLIVWPHGGPHAAMLAEYAIYPVAFCLLGIAVLFVNYRGSTGCGENSLKSILGNIGTQDVKDVQAVAQAALETGKFDEEYVFITGGSHGGFLTAHVIGQYPEFYRAAAIRNPVTNVASMADVTDIPDWNYVESGFHFTHDIIPTAEHYKTMLECSPIVHANKIKTPLLILIGENDKRVPPSQGKTFYRALKAMDKEVKLLWYPDNNHPLSKVDAEADVFVNTARWFYSYMAK